VRFFKRTRQIKFELQRGRELFAESG
jgi:hypothetical protein